MPHTCWHGFRSASSNGAFAFTPHSPKNLHRQWCSTNDSVSTTRRCLSSLTAVKYREKLSHSVLFPPCVIILLQLSVWASSKCHYVQVWAPAFRDHLTFYCKLGLFSQHLLLPQFACQMFRCCGKYQCVHAQGRYLSSPDHFSSLFLAELVCPKLAIPLLRETWHSRG